MVAIEKELSEIDWVNLFDTTCMSTEEACESFKAKLFECEDDKVNMYR